jgi:L-threonylcarbamoyladenylate synthase
LPFIPAALRLQLATDALAAGGVVACPTEAVWGLSCNPADALAVERLLSLKGRSVAKGLILVAAGQNQLDFLLEQLSDQDRSKVAASWPGPTTWLVPHGGRVPGWIHGDHATVAVRVSNHPVVRALCNAWDGPLVSTSANRAGARPPRELFQVKRFFGERLDYCLPGQVDRSARPSVIKDLVSGQIVRF